MLPAVRSLSQWELRRPKPLTTIALAMGRIHVTSGTMAVGTGGQRKSRARKGRAMARWTRLYDMAGLYLEAERDGHPRPRRAVVEKYTSAPYLMWETDVHTQIRLCFRLGLIPPEEKRG